MSLLIFSDEVISYRSMHSLLYQGTLLMLDCIPKMMIQFHTRSVSVCQLHAFNEDTLMISKVTVT